MTLTGVLLLALAGSGAAADAPVPLTTGNHAPFIEAIGVSGERVSLRWPAASGTLTAIFFFDVRSAAGIRGLTFFDRAWREAHDFGFNIIAVEASGAGLEAVRNGLERYGSVYPPPPFPVIADSGGTISRKFGLAGLPHTVLVEHHGVIIGSWEGFSERRSTEVAERLRAYLDLPERVLAGADADGTDQALPDESAPQRHLFAGDRIPSFAVTDIDGGNHEFPEDTDEQSMLIIYLWNDPCRPCIRGMLYLDQIYRRALDMEIPLRVLAVEADGLTREGVRTIMDRLGQIYQQPAFPVVADEEGRLSGTLGWDALPATYLIDSRGLLLSHSEGFSKGLAGEWIGIIESQISRARGVLGEIIE